MGQSIKIGLMGLGTVGNAFVRALSRFQSDGHSACENAMEIKKILVRHPDRHLDYDSRLTTDARDIIDDPEVAVVVELMGGMEPARSLMLAALKRGKAVVTANKEVMAHAGLEIWEASRKSGAGVYFEASVGAGIPVIQGIRRGLAGNQIHSITGVVNGTTNYILSRMTQDGLEFSTALREAQREGYAEVDPTDDIAGYDARRKIAILATVGFATWVSPDDVQVDGIAGITQDDIAYGLSEGWVLKLIATAHRQQDTMKISVRPTFLPQNHPIAQVMGAYNAIWVEADPVGNVMYYGLGAGGYPTASAILSDVLQAVRDLMGQHHEFWPVVDRHLKLDGSENSRVMSYWRLEVLDRPGTLAQVAVTLAKHGLSLRSVHQKPLSGGRALLFLVHHECAEHLWRMARTSVAQLSVVEHVGIPVSIWQSEEESRER